MHSRASSSVHRGLLDVKMLSGKEGLLGARWDEDSVKAMTSSASCPSRPFVLSQSPQKRTGWRCVAVRSSCVLWYQVLRVPLHSCVSVILPSRNKTSRRHRGLQRSLHILWARSGSLDERDVNKNTNKYRYSHKAALLRSYRKILLSISCFLFSVIKQFKKVNHKTFLFFTFVSYIHKNYFDIWQTFTSNDIKVKEQK